MEPRILSGFAHCHTTRSYDGKLSYSELRERLVARGLSFVLMTEHIEGLTAADIEVIRQDCHEHSDDRFLFIPGIEMDHFVVYFVGLGGGQLDISTPDRAYTTLRAASRMMVLSHPIKAKWSYPDWILRDADGIELINTKHDGRHYFRPQTERLFADLRALRPEAVGISGMDVHDPTQISDVWMTLERTVPLQEAAVLGEILAGRFEIQRGGRPLATRSRLRRGVRRARTSFMDLAHAGNRSLRQRGLKVPRHWREKIRKLFEGG